MADEIGVLQDGIAFVLEDVAVDFQDDMVAGQGAGFIGAKDIHGAEVLDGVEPLDDDFLAGHGQAPLDRQTETIMGSISGVNPTATDREKKNACFQSCLRSR
jgi:hypothetical protein